MLLTEYDEEKHMRDTYKEGYEEGERSGVQLGYNKLLDELISKKLDCGKNSKEISEELGIDINIVEERTESLKKTTNAESTSNER